MSAPRTDIPGWAVEGQRNADILIRDLRDLRAATDPHDALGHVVDALDWTLTRADRGELSPLGRQEYLATRAPTPPSADP